VGGRAAPDARAACEGHPQPLQRAAGPGVRVILHAPQSLMPGGRCMTAGPGVRRLYAA
jgi:hypothetical protein